MADEELLTVAEVARRLRLSQETIRRWIRGGKLQAIRIGSDRAGFRIRRTEIDQLLEPKQLPLPREDVDQKKAAA
jgi:excisionase family DNA binding protein